MTTRTNRLQSHAESGKIVQAATSHKNSEGASRLRRRLSKIFQRAISGRGLRTFCPLEFGTFGEHRGKIWQSPRVQRCRRFAKPSYEVGYSSSSSMSVVSAARAKSDSNRS